MNRTILFRSVGCGLLAGALTAAACSSSKSPTEAIAVAQSKLPRDMKPAASSDDQSALVAGNTAFAFDVYHQLVAGGSTTNAFFSPYSISLALAMAYAGAAGTTHDQMAAALHFTLPDARFHVAFDAVDLAVQTPPAAGAQGQEGHPFALSLADTVFLDQSTASLIAEPFLDTLATDYGAAAYLLDFQGNPDPSRLAINAWTADQTNQRIPDLLPFGSIDPSTRVVLVNAVYFNAGWSTGFALSATHPAVFTALDGTSPTVAMMQQQATTSYYQGANYQVIDLPYQGGTTSMTVVLPTAGNLAAVEASLDGPTLSAAIASESQQQVVVSLPKWTSTGATISLKNTLSALGMTDAFVRGTANFTGISTEEQLFISDVFHEAFIDIDESGTEAAAATSVVFDGDAGASAPAAPPILFTADHPYLLFIRDTVTGSILFFGRVTNPSM